MIKVEDLMQKLNKQAPNFTVELNGEEYGCDRLPFGQILSIDDNHAVDTEVGSFNRSMEVIYMSCPVFRQLANQTEITGDPYKIVEKVLQPAEIYTMYSQILQNYFNQQTINVEAVKKP